MSKVLDSELRLPAEAQSGRQNSTGNFCLKMSINEIKISAGKA
jgi:hypothetical protein